MNRERAIFWAAMFLAAGAFFSASGFGYSLWLSIVGPVACIVLLGLLLRDWRATGLGRQFLAACVIGIAVFTPIEYAAWHVLGMMVVAALWLLNSQALGAAVGLLILATGFVPLLILLFLLAGHLLRRLPFFARAPGIDLASVLALSSAFVLYVVTNVRLAARLWYILH